MTDASDKEKPMKTIDAVSIIAGTAIGGGFLALPSVTAPLGYMPAAVGLVLVWAFLVLTATSFVEAAGHVIAQADIDGEVAAVSHASIISKAFGPRLAVLGGFAFIAQMIAVITAQVVKGGEFIAHVTGAPYVAACLLPTIGFGLFTFLCPAKLVERTNTTLAAAMLLGFAALVIGALSLSGGGAAAAGAAAAGGVAAGGVAAGGVASASAAAYAAPTWLVSKGSWARLLPFGAETWAVPVFLNLLCFAQSIPLIVQRLLVDVGGLGAGAGSSAAAADENKQSSAAEVAAAAAKANEKARSDALGKARAAVVGGSAVPLALSLCWAAVAAALIPAATAATGYADPIFALLTLGTRIAVPVGLLAIGAIGTTLLSSFLAMGHFGSELLCSTFGVCSLRDIALVRLLTVAVPCLLACGGPALYLPLLSFSGAYPTTILYTLSPPIAALVLRRRAAERRATALATAAKATGEEAAMLTATAPPAPRELVPGGTASLAVLATVALAVLGSSSALAAASLFSFAAAARAVAA